MPIIKERGLENYIGKDVLLERSRRDVRGKLYKECKEGESFRQGRFVVAVRKEGEVGEKWHYVRKGDMIFVPQRVWVGSGRGRRKETQLRPYKFSN